MNIGGGGVAMGLVVFEACGSGDCPITEAHLTRLEVQEESKRPPGEA